MLIRIISVDSLGHGRGICGAKSIQFGWRMVGESPVEYNLQGVGHRWGKFISKSPTGRAKVTNQQ